MIKKVIGFLALASIVPVIGHAEAASRFHHHHCYRHHYSRHHQRFHHHHRHVVFDDAVPAGGGHALGGGLASWYHGRESGLTAAHRSLPFGTRVLVTNRSNGRAVVVRINDRGPFIRGRVIDLSKTAANAIGVTGVSPVTLRRL